MCSLRLVFIQWRFNDEQAAYQHHICASRPELHAQVEAIFKKVVLK